MNISKILSIATKCLILSALGFAPVSSAETKLADKPLFTSYSVPGNVALALSVEYPTALLPSYGKSSTYDIKKDYLGYFDPRKCYYYNNSSKDPQRRYFEPMALASGLDGKDHTCNSNPTDMHWSGNFLNWAITQAIDPFRQVLTGGYRVIDEPNFTVLEKAWNSGQSQNVFNRILQADLVQGATPFKFNPPLPLIAEVDGWGNEIAFAAKFTGGADPSSAFTYPEAINNSTPATGGTKVSEDKLYEYLNDSNTNTAKNNLFRVFARVQACKSGLKEKNCVAYGSNLKPEGLIQKNALKMNFAAFGHLKQDDRYQSGGILRARMASLGPMMPAPGKIDKKNDNAEWDGATGTFNSNPRSEDAKNSWGSNLSVANSGVINYLNKFGEPLSTSSNKRFAYMHYDEVSELFYAISRYYRNKGSYAPFNKSANGKKLTASSANPSAQQINEFPLIAKWDDPIQYSCQQNFVIGLGDTWNSSDAHIPGSSNRNDGFDDDTLPSDDPTINADKFTNYIGLAQGYTIYKNLGTKITPWSSTGGRFYIAGLAYDLHVSDMRPDLPGKQTAKTYWLDVLENDQDRKNQGESGMRNQFWLAAKYGGFDLPAGKFEPYDTDNPLKLSASQWDKNGDDDPDNYFRATDPKLMQDNLTKAFDDILLNIEKSSSALAVTNPNIADGDFAYTSAYKVDGWSGDIVAKKASVDVNTGLVSATTTLWSAAEKLEAHTPSTRIIATAKCTSSGTTQQCTGVPFQIDKLASEDSSHLSGLTNAAGASLSAGDVLNYLRGNRTVINNNRKKILGDIVAPQPIVVGAPNAGYSDATNPGYSTFKNNNKNRATIIYSGANDGMLHAFAGGATGGKELFAYVPQALFKGSNNPATPNEDGLAALAKDSYSHHAYVDKTPVVQDVNFGANKDDWHSLLVGGLGKGGKAYYALDMTDPSGFTDESKLAAKVLWEFKHPNLGFSYGTPLIVKTKKDGWVVILTSGYNNADSKGHFFIIKPKDGSLIQDIAVPSGHSSDGVAHASAFVNAFSDGTADAVYAGDLQGNVWRLDLNNTTTTNAYEAPALIAQFKSSTEQPQPITTAPALALDAYTGRRFVFIGTGRLLDDADITSDKEQSFYAIIDGARQKFFAAPASPTTRDNLSNNTNVDGLAVSSAHLGWYIDLGFVTDEFGKIKNVYRINAPITVSAGVVSFAKNLPDNSDVCNPSGNAEGFGISYSTGKTVLPAGKKHVHIDGLVNLINFYNTAPFDQGVVISFNADGGSTSAATDPCPNNQCRTVSPANNFRVLNWREVNAE